MVVRSGHKVESKTGHNVDSVGRIVHDEKKKKKKRLAKDGQSDQSLRVARRLRAVLKTPFGMAVQAIKSEVAVCKNGNPASLPIMRSARANSLRINERHPLSTEISDKSCE